MNEFWLIGYDAENSENPGQYLHVTVGEDGTLRIELATTRPAEADTT
jgi:hypothetical protein